MTLDALWSPINLLIFLDTDECSTGIHTCDVNAICVNNVGSYECRCKDGYLGTGRNCAGIILKSTITKTEEKIINH